MNKQYRLKRNEEIGKVVSFHQAVRNESFIIYFKENSNNENMRVCISVSKKIGNAVVRNKIKRQVRDMTRRTFDVQKRYDYVIVIRQRYLQNTFSTNLENLKKVYNRINHKE